MKLHLPSRLRKALLACLASLAVPALSVTVSTGSALVGGSALISFLMGQQAKAAGDEEDGDVAPAAEEVLHLDGGTVQATTEEYESAEMSQGTTLQFSEDDTDVTISGEFTGTGDLRVDGHESAKTNSHLYLNGGGTLEGSLNVFDGVVVSVGGDFYVTALGGNSGVLAGDGTIHITGAGENNGSGLLLDIQEGLTISLGENAVQRISGGEFNGDLHLSAGSTAKFMYIQWGGTSSTFGGALSGEGTLQIGDGGTAYTLTWGESASTDSFTGTIDITKNSSFVVNADLSLDLLAGSGSLTVSVGTFSVQNSAEQSSFTGSLTINSGATFAYYGSGSCSFLSTSITVDGVLYLDGVASVGSFSGEGAVRVRSDEHNGWSLAMAGGEIGELQVQDNNGGGVVLVLEGNLTAGDWRLTNISGDSSSTAYTDVDKITLMNGATLELTAATFDGYNAARTIFVDADTAAEFIITPSGNIGLRSSLHTGSAVTLVKKGSDMLILGSSGGDYCTVSHHLIEGDVHVMEGKLRINSSALIQGDVTIEEGATLSFWKKYSDAGNWGDVTQERVIEGEISGAGTLEFINEELVLKSGGSIGSLSSGWGGSILSLGADLTVGSVGEISSSGSDDITIRKWADAEAESVTFYIDISSDTNLNQRYLFDESIIFGKKGSGQLMVQDASKIQGAIVIEEGILRIDGDTGLSDARISGSGGVLWLQSSEHSIASLDYDGEMRNFKILSLANGGRVGTLVNAWGGSISLGADLTIGGAAKDEGYSDGAFEAIEGSTASLIFDTSAGDIDIHDYSWSYSGIGLGVTGGHTLSINTATFTTLSIEDSSTLLISSSKTLTLTGSSSVTGSLIDVEEGGTLKIKNGSLSLNGDTSFSGTFLVDGDNSQTATATVSGSFSANILQIQAGEITLKQGGEVSELQFDFCGSNGAVVKLGADLTLDTVTNNNSASADWHKLSFSNTGSDMVYVITGSYDTLNKLTTVTIGENVGLATNAAMSLSEDFTFSGTLKAGASLTLDGSVSLGSLLLQGQTLTLSGDSILSVGSLIGGDSASAAGVITLGSLRETGGYLDITGAGSAGYITLDLTGIALSDGLTIELFSDFSSIESGWLDHLVFALTGYDTHLWTITYHEEDGTISISSAIVASDYTWEGSADALTWGGEGEDIEWSGQGRWADGSEATFSGRPESAEEVTVTLGADIEASSLALENSEFLFTGDHSLTVELITVDASATATFAEGVTLSFTQATVDGLLEVNGAVAVDGELLLEGSGDIVLNGGLGGSGSVTITGEGLTVTLGGESFGGSIEVVQGSLYTGQSVTALSSLTLSGEGASLDTAGALTITSLTMGSGASATLSGDLSITSLTLGTSGNYTFFAGDEATGITVTVGNALSLAEQQLAFSGVNVSLSSAFTLNGTGVLQVQDGDLTATSLTILGGLEDRPGAKSLDVSGSVTLSGTFALGNAAGNITAAAIGGGLTIEGGTLNIGISGADNNNSLPGSKASLTIGGDLSITGSQTVTQRTWSLVVGYGTGAESYLSVGGSVTLSSGFYIYGSTVEIGGDVTVGGVAFFANTNGVTIGGDMTAASGFTVYGLADVDLDSLSGYTLDIAGGVTVTAGSFQVCSGTYTTHGTSKVRIGEDVIIQDGGLAVGTSGGDEEHLNSGSAELTIGGDLSVTGVYGTGNNNFSIGVGTSSDSSLTVMGDLTADGAVNIGGNSSTGDLTVGGTASIGGALTLNNGSLTVTGNLTAGGTLTLNNGSLTVTGNLTASGAVNIGSDTTYGVFTVDGQTQIVGNVTMKNSSSRVTFNDDVTIAAWLYMRGGELTLNGDMQVGYLQWYTSDVTIKGAAGSTITINGTGNYTSGGTGTLTIGEESARIDLVVNAENSSKAVGFRNLTLWGDLTLNSGSMRLVEGDMIIHGSLSVATLGTNQYSEADASITVEEGATIGTLNATVSGLSLTLGGESSISAVTGSQSFALTIMKNGTLSLGSSASLTSLTLNGTLKMGSNSGANSVTIAADGSFTLGEGATLAIDSTGLSAESALLVFTDYTLSGGGKLTVDLSAWAEGLAEALADQSEHRFALFEGLSFDGDWTDFLEFTGFADRHWALSYDDGALVFTYLSGESLTWETADSGAVMLWKAGERGWNDTDDYQNDGLESVSFEAEQGGTVKMEGELVAEGMSVNGQAYTFQQNDGYSDATSLTVETLTLEEGATLTFEGIDFTVNAGIELAEGASATITVSGAQLTLGQGVSTAADISLSEGASLATTGAVTLSGSLTVDAATTVHLGGTLTVNGDTDLTNLTFVNAATTGYALGDASDPTQWVEQVYASDDSKTADQLGTYTEGTGFKKSGSGTLTITEGELAMPIWVAEGGFTLAGGITATGDITVTSGGTLTLNGTAEAGGNTLGNVTIEDGGTLAATDKGDSDHGYLHSFENLTFADSLSAKSFGQSEKFSANVSGTLTIGSNWTIMLGLSRDDINTIGSVAGSGKLKIANTGRVIITHGGSIGDLEFDWNGVNLTLGGDLEVSGTLSKSGNATTNNKLLSESSHLVLGSAAYAAKTSYAEFLTLYTAIFTNDAAHFTAGIGIGGGQSATFTETGAAWDHSFIITSGATLTVQGEGGFSMASGATLTVGNAAGAAGTLNLNTTLDLTQGGSLVVNSAGKVNVGAGGKLMASGEGSLTSEGAITLSGGALEITGGDFSLGELAIGAEGSTITIGLSGSASLSLTGFGMEGSEGYDFTINLAGLTTSMEGYQLFDQATWELLKEYEEYITFVWENHTFIENVEINEDGTLHLTLAEPDLAPDGSTLVWAGSDTVGDGVWAAEDTDEEWYISEEEPEDLYLYANGHSYSVIFAEAQEGTTTEITLKGAVSVVNMEVDDNYSFDITTSGADASSLTVTDTLTVNGGSGDEEKTATFTGNSTLEVATLAGDGNLALQGVQATVTTGGSDFDGSITVSDGGSLTLEEGVTLGVDSLITVTGATLALNGNTVGDVTINENATVTGWDAASFHDLYISGTSFDSEAVGVITVEDTLTVGESRILWVNGGSTINQLSGGGDLKISGTDAVEITYGGSIGLLRMMYGGVTVTIGADLEVAGITGQWNGASGNNTQHLLVKEGVEGPVHVILTTTKQYAESSSTEYTPDTFAKFLALYGYRHHSQGNGSRDAFDVQTGIGFTGLELTFTVGAATEESPDEGTAETWSNDFIVKGSEEQSGSLTINAAADGSSFAMAEGKTLTVGAYGSVTLNVMLDLSATGANLVVKEDGSLTLGATGGLKLGSGSSLEIDALTATEGATLAFADDFTFSAGMDALITFGSGDVSGSLKLDLTGVALSAGEFTIFDGEFDGLTITVSGYDSARWNVSYDDGTLSISRVTLSDLYWATDADGTWSADDTEDWAAADGQTGTDVFADGASVHFGSSTVTTVTVDGDVSVNNMEVQNNYTFTAAETGGSITVTGDLSITSGLTTLQDIDLTVEGEINAGSGQNNGIKLQNSSLTLKQGGQIGELNYATVSENDIYLGGDLSIDFMRGTNLSTLRFARVPGDAGTDGDLVTVTIKGGTVLPTTHLSFDEGINVVFEWTPTGAISQDVTWTFAEDVSFSGELKVGEPEGEDGALRDNQQGHLVVGQDMSGTHLTVQNARSTVDVDGDLKLQNKLTNKGDITVGGDLSANNIVQSQGSLTVTGNASTNESVNITGGAVSVENDLTVTMKLTNNGGNISVDGKLTAQDIDYTQGSLTVGSLAVTGTLTFSDGTLTVTGNGSGSSIGTLKAAAAGTATLYLGEDLQITKVDGHDASNANYNISFQRYIGDSADGGDVSSITVTIASFNASTNKNMTFGEHVDVYFSTGFTGSPYTATLTVEDNATFNGNLQVSTGSVSVGGDATFESGNVTLNNSGSITVDGDMELASGNLTLNNALAEISVGKKLSVGGTASITNGQLTLKGGADFSSTLALNGEVHLEGGTLSVTGELSGTGKLYVDIAEGAQLTLASFATGTSIQLGFDESDLLDLVGKTGYQLFTAGNWQSEWLEFFDLYTLNDYISIDEYEITITGDGYLRVIALGDDLVWNDDAADNDWYADDSSHEEWFYDDTTRETAFKANSSVKFLGAGETISLHGDIIVGDMDVEGNYVFNTSDDATLTITGTLTIGEGKTMGVQWSGVTVEGELDAEDGTLFVAQGQSITLQQGGTLGALEHNQVTITLGGNLSIGNLTSKGWLTFNSYNNAEVTVELKESWTPAAKTITFNEGVSLLLTGDRTFNVATTLAFNGGTMTVEGDLTFTGNAKFTYNGSSSLHVEGDVTSTSGDTESLTFNGTGESVIEGALNFAGTVTTGGDHSLTIQGAGDSSINKLTSTNKTDGSSNAASLTLGGNLMISDLQGNGAISFSKWDEAAGGITVTVGGLNSAASKNITFNEGVTAVFTHGMTQAAYTGTLTAYENLTFSGKRVESNGNGQDSPGTGTTAGTGRAFFLGANGTIDAKKDLTVSGGDILSSGTITVGGNASLAGVASITGGSVQVTNTLTANAGLGITGGSVTVGTLTVTSGDLTLSGGLLTVNTSMSVIDSVNITLTNSELIKLGENFTFSTTSKLDLAFDNLTDYLEALKGDGVALFDFEGWSGDTSWDYLATVLELSASDIPEGMELRIGRRGHLLLVDDNGLSPTATLTWAGKDGTWGAEEETKEWDYREELYAWSDEHDVLFVDGEAGISHEITLEGKIIVGQMTVRSGEFTFVVNEGDDASLSGTTLELETGSSAIFTGEEAKSPVVSFEHLAGSGSLTVSGSAVSVEDADGFTGNVTVSGGQLSLNGEDGLSLSGAITVSGGELTLTTTDGDLTLGEVEVSGGTLNLNAAGSIGSLTADGGEVYVTAALSVDELSGSTDGVINGGETGSSLTVQGGASYSGQLQDISVSFDLGAGASFTLDGELDGVDLTVTSGTLVMGATNTVDSLAFGATGALEIEEGVTLTVESALDGADGSITGEGSLTLTGGAAGNDYSGSIAVGALTVTNGSQTLSGEVELSGALTVESSGELTIGEFTAGSASVSGSLTLTGGAEISGVLELEENATFEHGGNTVQVGGITGGLALDGITLVITGADAEQSYAGDVENAHITVTGGTQRFEGSFTAAEVRIEGDAEDSAQLIIAEENARIENARLAAGGVLEMTKQGEIDQLNATGGKLVSGDSMNIRELYAETGVLTIDGGSVAVTGGIHIDSTGSVVVTADSLDIAGGLFFQLDTTLNTIDSAYLHGQEGNLVAADIPADGISLDIEGDLTRGTYYLASGLDGDLTLDDFSYDGVLEALEAALKSANADDVNGEWKLALELEDGVLSLKVTYSNSDLWIWDGSHTGDNVWHDGNANNWNQDEGNTRNDSPQVYFYGEGDGEIQVSNTVTPGAMVVKGGHYIFTHIGAEGGIDLQGDVDANKDNPDGDARLIIGGDQTEAHVELNLKNKNIPQVDLLENGKLTIGHEGAVNEDATITMDGGTLAIGEGAGGSLILSELGGMTLTLENGSSLNLQVGKTYTEFDSADDYLGVSGAATIAARAADAQTFTLSGGDTVKAALTNGINKSGRQELAVLIGEDELDATVSGTYNALEGTLRLVFSTAAEISDEAELNVTTGATLVLESTDDQQLTLKSSFTNADAAAALAEMLGEDATARVELVGNVLIDEEADNSGFSGVIALDGSITAKSNNSLGGAGTTLELTGGTLTLGDQVSEISVAEIQALGKETISQEDPQATLKAARVSGDGTLATAAATGAVTGDATLTLEADLAEFTGTLQTSSTSWTLAGAQSSDTLSLTLSGEGEIVFSDSLTTTGDSLILTGTIGNGGSATALVNEMTDTTLVIAGDGSGSTGSLSGKIQLGNAAAAGSWGGTELEEDTTFTLVNGTLSGDSFTKGDGAELLADVERGCAVNVNGMDGSNFDGITVKASGQLQNVSGTITAGGQSGITVELVFDENSVGDPTGGSYLITGGGTLTVEDADSLKLDFTNQSFFNLLMTHRADDAQSWLHIYEGGTIEFGDAFAEAEASGMLSSVLRASNLGKLLYELGFNVTVDGGDLILTGTSTDVYLVVDGNEDVSNDSSVDGWFEGLGGHKATVVDGTLDVTAGDMEAEAEAFGYTWNEDAGTWTAADGTTKTDEEVKEEKGLTDAQLEGVKNDQINGGRTVNNLVGLEDSEFNAHNSKANDADFDPDEDREQIVFNNSTVNDHDSTSVPDDAEDQLTENSGVDTVFEGTINGDEGVDFVKKGAGNLTVGSESGKGGVQAGDSDFTLEEGSFTVQGGDDNRMRDLVFSDGENDGGFGFTNGSKTTADKIVESDTDDNGKDGGNVTIDDEAELVLTGKSELEDTTITGDGSGTLTVDDEGSGEGGLTLTGENAGIDGVDLNVESGEVTVEDGATIKDSDITLNGEDASMTVTGEDSSITGEGSIAVKDGGSLELADGADIDLSGDDADITVAGDGSSITLSDDSSLKTEGDLTLEDGGLLDLGNSADNSVGGLNGDGTLKGGEDSELDITGSGSSFSGTLAAEDGAASGGTINVGEGSDFTLDNVTTDPGAAWDMNVAGGGKLTVDVTDGGTTDLGDITLSDGGELELKYDKKGGSVNGTLNVEDGAKGSLTVDVTQNPKNGEIDFGDLKLGDGTTTDDLDFSLTGTGAEHFKGHLDVRDDGTLYAVMDKDNTNKYLKPGMTVNVRAGAEMMWDLTDPDSVAYAYAMGAGKGSDLYRLANAMSLLNCGLFGDVNLDKTYAAVAGASISTLGSAFDQDVKRQMSNIRNRAMMLSDATVNADPGEPSFHAWVSAETQYHKLEAQGYDPGFTLNGWGGSVGVNVEYDANVSFGLALTAMYNDLKTDSADSGKGDIDTTWLSAFARVSSGAWSHTFIASAGMSEITLNRTVDYVLGSYHTHGETDGFGLGLMYEVGYTVMLNREGTLALQPIANVQYRYENINGYSESGSDAGLRVNDIKRHALTFGVGARMQGVVSENAFGRASVFEARFLMKHDTGDRQSTAMNTLLHGTNAQQVQSATSGRVGIELGAGLTIPVGSNGGTIFFDVSYEFRSRANTMNASAGYRVSF